MKLLSPIVLFISGCIETNQGTSVGNPTEMTVQIAGSTDVLLEEGSLPVSEIEVGFIDRESDTISVESVEQIDDALFQLPNGAWNFLTISFDAPINLQGRTQTGLDASLSINVPAIRMLASNEEVVFAENVFILEIAFPGWLDEEHAQYNIAESIVVEEGSEIHDRLSQAIIEQSSLFRDSNGDYTLNDQEREENSQAQGARERE